MTTLDEALADEKAAVGRRQALEKAERESMGYPEFDTKEWQQHQWDLAKRYSELETDQRVRMSTVPGVHQLGPAETSEVWIVQHNDHRSVVMLRGANPLSMCMVDYGMAYPFGIGNILRELEVIE